MEFIKSCNTNAQAIGDYEAIAYQAFTIRRSSTYVSLSGQERHASEDLRAVEAELRQGQNLVVQDVSKPWLWLFRATTVDKVSDKPQELPVIEGYELQRQQFGVMRALELARPAIRSPNFNAMSAASASTGSPLTPGSFKGSQSGGARVPDQQQPHDNFAVYELFTSSVLALMSYYLVKDHNAVALNYRTFLSRSTDKEGSGTTESNSSQAPFKLTNVNVYWASSGTLLVSSFSFLKPEIRRLDELLGEESQGQIVGGCVRIAPNGSLAQVVSFDDPLEVAIEDLNQRKQRKRVKTGPAEQGIERWKSIVTHWLAWKGYSLTGLEKNTAWVRIRVAQTGYATPPSPSMSSQYREVLWPRALCFFYERPSSISASLDLAMTSSNEPGLQWFGGSHSGGFQDPIDVAQQWFLSKPERDRLFEARRKAQKVEEEATRTKEENSGGLFPSSPLNSRTGAYGDLQAVSGVYPTPPDGIVPGTAVSSGDSISGSTSNTVLVPGGSNPAINLSAPKDNIHSEEQLLPGTSPDVSQPYDTLNTSGGNDDLFEDMDGDSFGGNGITDADFNFFDEPDDDDDDDVDMLDAPDTKAPIAKKGEIEKLLPAPPSADVKEEASDPMAALEDALESASHPTEEQAVNAKMEDGGEDEIPAKAIEDEQSQPQAMPLQETPLKAVQKEPTPPLSPHRIQERLLPSPKDKSIVQLAKHHTIDHQKDSVFDPINFNRKMSLSDAKYHDGRFSFPQEKAQKESREKKMAVKRPASLRDLPLLTELRYAIGVASNRGIAGIKASSRTGDDTSDSSSDTSSLAEDDAGDLNSLPSEPVSAGLIGPAKRKFPTDGNATPLSAISFADSLGDMLDFAGLQTDDTALIAFEPNPWDWSLADLLPPRGLPSNVGRYFVPTFTPVISSMPNTPTSQLDLGLGMPEEKPLNRNDSIAIAQIVTDQIASATLYLFQEDKRFELEVPTPPSSDAELQSIVKRVFPTTVDCSVAKLISVSDVFPELPPQAKGQQRPIPRRPNESPVVPGHHIHQLTSPHVRVRRADTLWDLLPPSLAFWESLGLYPCSPAKNVGAFCIYPHSDSLRPCLEHFLINLQIAYETCKLGSHERVDAIPGYEGGLVPCTLSNPSSTTAAFKALRETCIGLGKALAVKYAQMRENQGSLKVDAFVIYIINPFKKASAVWELCSSFWALFQAYGQGPSSRPDQVQKPDLVLQIVPIEYIASFDVPVILDSTTYAGLAREVYDRCPPSAPSEDKTPLSIYAAPSFQLEEGIPRQIPFRLNAEPPQDLLHENSYLHIGYAISVDGNWVTAAWTDNCGKSRTVVSYNLGTRAFSEIAKEIWQTTLEICQARRVTWRICVTRSGVMDREEFEAWVSLALCPTQFNLFVTLLTVDTNPSLNFIPTIPSTNPQPGTTNTSSNTPGSTPQATVSPDAHNLTPAATPAAETATDPSNDPEARLIDITDETWSIILAHRLHNSHSTVEFRPAVISGLLVKRGLPSTTSVTSSAPSPPTPDPERGPIVVAVNIIWVAAINPTRAATSPFPPPGDGVSPGGQIPQSPAGAENSRMTLLWTPTPQARSTAENLLKEIIAQFRALGTLARLKGIRGTRMGAVPWHVAVAQRGVEKLSACVPENI